MKLKRKISIAVGTLLLVAGIVYLAVFMPKTAQENHDLMMSPASTTEQTEETGTVTEEKDTKESQSDLPEIDIESWEYILANSEHTIGNYSPELGEMEGQQFDVRILEPMQQFVAAAREEGLNVYLSSGYRSYEEQEYLFNRKAEQYGEEEAGKIVNRPGTSEHQTGLACDITDTYYELKDSSLENTALYQWMSKHCQEYGFIIRYPKDKEDITGIIYEPWHFRYVGVTAAKYMVEHNLCLEEFVELYK